MSKCVNCGFVSDTNYCPDCGQHLKAKRITLKTITSEITDRWLGLDTKFARTFRDLTIRPAQLIQSYLDRNTVKYVGPLGYFIVVSALMLLAFDLFDVPIGDLMREASKNYGGNEVLTGNQAEFQEKVFALLSSNFRLISGLIIPFTSLGVFLMFRDRQNFIESLVIAMYIHSHTIWITILTIPFVAYFKIDFTKYSLVIGMAYFIWGVGSYFRVQSKKSYLKAFLAWGFGIMTFIVCLIVMAAIIVIFFYKQ